MDTIMPETVSRRDFLKVTSVAASSAAAIAAPRPVLKTSLNAYSFNKMLNDSIKGRGAGITLVQVLEFAAKNKFEGFDATGYYFPGYPERPANDYIDTLKRRAAGLGVAISGTGVRNNFTTSDKATRDAGVKHIKEFVEVAARLGAPVVRVFADTQMRSQTWETVAKGYTRDRVQDWIAAAADADGVAAGVLRDCSLSRSRLGIVFLL